MNEDINKDGFIFHYPIWCLMSCDKSDLKFCRIDTYDGKSAAPLFTDEDVAKSFIRTIGMTGAFFELTQLPDANHLLNFLRLCEKRGVYYVGIDSKSESGRFFFPTTQIINAVEGASG